MIIIRIGRKCCKGQKESQGMRLPRYARAPGFPLPPLLGLNPYFICIY
jgi:hypothetical protein